MNEKLFPSQRQLKISQQIRFLVSNFFLKEDFLLDGIDSKNLTVVDVVLSSDLKIAKVYLTSNSKQENLSLIKELNKKASFVSSKIAKLLGTKYSPKIKFFYDNSLDYSEKINHILNGIGRDKNGN